MLESFINDEALPAYVVPTPPLERMKEMEIDL